ncbi:DUF2971 domain-containing protein [Steroidobacter sp.]|uniref:DUF2971 domain-containing protein n=1 Tax=Steroidobacter sp. TaxID=1978227 RepID=UPI001A37D2EE|nr:DUF2971 domain-containing protein [Steroidobacter sp.]MBL8268651.1 DUF2971 domain-containing protein [Steroidobacter sp.]
MTWRKLARYAPSGSHIYHYTDAAALISILEKGELRFTDIECLNDELDSTYLGELYKKAARDLKAGLREDPDGRAAKFLDLVEGKARYLPVRPFVCCFSRQYDALNQWRNYTGAGSYCIAFDRDQLVSTVEELCGKRSGYAFWAGDVDYGGAESVPVQLASSLRSFLEATKPPMPLQHTISYEAEHRSDRVQESLQEADAIRFKHISFKHEAEYRIAMLSPPGAVAKDKVGEAGVYLDYFAHRSFIRPSVVVRFGARFKSMIKAVCVGPGTYKTVAREKVTMMLRHFDYRIDDEHVVPVEESESTFRHI